MASERKLPTSAAAIKRRPALSGPMQRSVAAAAPSPAHTLQQRLGNRGTRTFIDSRWRPAQPKLAVSTPGDPFEREADRVAEQVMRTADPSPPEIRRLDRPPAQRVCAECEEEAESEKKATVQRKCGPCAAEEEEGKAQRTPEEGAPAEATPQVTNLRGGGAPLSSPVRAFFEPRFGRDLSAVRVHDGAEAAGAARSIHALAYTVGSDIVFGAGQYQPSSETGQRLLAHELTHTIQQSGADAPMLMGTWETDAKACASEPKDKTITTVQVEQEKPQSVTVFWSDGSIDSDESSSGKGMCCVPPGTDGVACDTAGSRKNGSHCTPITEPAGKLIAQHLRVGAGNPFWSEFDDPRDIALHQFDPVDGTPLSHGCVRLHMDMARRIWCGVTRKTRVHVRGFARPSCDWAALQSEWAGDGVSDPKAIPRCKKSAAQPTAEEARLYEYPSPAGPAQTTATAAPPAHGTVPVQLLAASGFGKLFTDFRAGMEKAKNLAGARTVVDKRALDLWKAATARSQGGDTDDRPLYWARLEAVRFIRQWEPAWTLGATDRAALIEAFEKASRGMTAATFSGKAGNKRILISGFDPFQLDFREGGDVRRANPSGAAVLALDGTTVSKGGVIGEIHGAVFPVRYAEFDAGWVESFFQPFLTSSSPPNMIMTISQGGAAFEVEHYASVSRGQHTGNVREPATGSLRGKTGVLLPPGMTGAPEFTETTLPETAIRTALGRSAPLPGEVEATEMPAGKTTTRTFTPTTGGPTAGSTAIEGSGGDYLSNEIMYRTTLVRDRSGNKSVPVGHLHTPAMGLPKSGVTDAAFEKQRNDIVDTIKKILTEVLTAI